MISNKFKKNAHCDGDIFKTPQKPILTSERLEPANETYSLLIDQSTFIIIITALVILESLH